MNESLVKIEDKCFLMIFIYWFGYSYFSCFSSNGIWIFEGYLELFEDGNGGSDMLCNKRIFLMDGSDGLGDIVLTILSCDVGIAIEVAYIFRFYHCWGEPFQSFLFFFVLFEFKTSWLESYWSVRALFHGTFFFFKGWLLDNSSV